MESGARGRDQCEQSKAEGGRGSQREDTFSPAAASKKGTIFSGGPRIGGPRESRESESPDTHVYISIYGQFIWELEKNFKHT